MVAAHLDVPLMKEYNVRSLTVRKGDTVKVIRGHKDFKSGEAKVASVDTKNMKIIIENITVPKADGTFPEKGRELLLGIGRAAAIPALATLRAGIGAERAKARGAPPAQGRAPIAQQFRGRRRREAVLLLQAADPSPLLVNGYEQRSAGIPLQGRGQLSQLLRGLDILPRPVQIPVKEDDPAKLMPGDVFHHRMAGINAESGETHQKQLAQRQIIVYIEKLGPMEALELHYSVKAKFPIKAQTPLSKAYPYYNPEQATVSAPQFLVVNK